MQPTAGPMASAIGALSLLTRARRSRMLVAGRSSRRAMRYVIIFVDSSGVFFGRSLTISLKSSLVVALNTWHSNGHVMHGIVQQTAGLIGRGRRCAVETHRRLRLTEHAVVRERCGNGGLCRPRGSHKLAHGLYDSQARIRIVTRRSVCADALVGTCASCPFTVARTPHPPQKEIAKGEVRQLSFTHLRA